MKKRPAMERPYAVLQKKLHELESILNEMFFHSAKVDNSGFYDEIMARIGFLKTLYAAEMESNAQGSPHHLPHIAGRLAALEDAFHNWVDSGIPPEDHLDDLSVCSCTHSCFNDVGEDDDCVPEPEYFAPMPSKTQVMSSQEMGEERKRHRLGSLPCVFMSAAVAVAAMAIGFVTNCSRVEAKVFLVPT